MKVTLPHYPEYANQSTLLEALLDRFDVAYKYLLILCRQEIIPSILHANPKLSQWEAEEKVFDALAVLVELLYDNKVKDSARSLLWSITKNKIVDLIRKKVGKDENDAIIPRIVSLDELAAFELDFITCDLFSPMETQAYKNVLYALTKTERHVLDLSVDPAHQFDESADQAISSQLDLSLKTVQNCKVEIRKKVKEHF